MLNYMEKISSIADLIKHLHKIYYSDCILLNIAGGVAVGKTTFANELSKHLNNSGLFTVVCSTDNFLYSNKYLAQSGFTQKKGWPETYNWSLMLDFATRCKFRLNSDYSTPIYCHKTYDIRENNYFHTPQPDVLIIEGVVALNNNFSSLLDYGIFLDTTEEFAKLWFTERCLNCIKASIGQPDNFYHRWSSWDTEKVMPVINDYWEQINMKNFSENILKTKESADLLIYKGHEHSLEFIVDGAKENA